MDITSVDEYLAEAPEPHRSTLIQLRATLRELLAHAEEAISYNMPAFKVGGQAVAGYASSRITAATSLTPSRCSHTSART